MRRFLALFLLCLLTLPLNACMRHTAPEQLVFSDWRLEKRVYKEKNANPSYQMEVSYPEIVSRPETPSGRDLNQAIQAYLAENFRQFKRHLPPDSLDSQDFPASLRNNVLRIQYVATVIHPRQHTLVSIRFETDTLFAGDPQHLHRFTVMNTDLSEGKMLTLASLFKADADYLKTLAQISQKKLAQRLTEGMRWMPWNYQGTLALPENFKLWNLEKGGLLLTFQEEQVTPYSATPQTILIPYASLRSLLSPATPVADFAYP